MALKRRLLPWLENPGYPTMSPHTGGSKTGTCHTDKTVERERRDMGGETTSEKNPLTRENAVKMQNYYSCNNALWSQNVWTPAICAHFKVADCNSKTCAPC